MTKYDDIHSVPHLQVSRVAACCKAGSYTVSTYALLDAAQDLLCYVNHSDAPNCVLQLAGDSLKLISTSDIDTCAELTISYGPELMVKSLFGMSPDEVSATNHEPVVCELFRVFQLELPEDTDSITHDLVELAKCLWQGESMPPPMYASVYSIFWGVKPSYDSNPRPDPWSVGFSWRPIDQRPQRTDNVCTMSLLTYDKSMTNPFSIGEKEIIEYLDRIGVDYAKNSESVCARAITDVSPCDTTTDDNKHD